MSLKLKVNATSATLLFLLIIALFHVGSASESLTQSERIKDLYSDDTEIAYPKIELSEDDVRMIRHVLGYWNIKNTVLEDALNYGGVPDYSAVVSQLTEQKLIPSQLFNNPVFLTKLGELHEITSSDDEEYAECKEDYSAYIEPITNRLLNVARSIFCSRNNLTVSQCSLIPTAPVIPLPSWGVQFIDAHGKIPEGITEGKIHWVGGHDLCHDLKVKRFVNETGKEREFEGKYCRLSLTPKFLEDRNISLPLLYGVCAPEHCRTQDVARFVNENLFLSYFLNETLSMSLTNVYCGQELDRSTDWHFQLAVGFIGSIVILLIIGTLYDGFLRPWLILKNLPSSSIANLDKSILDRKIGFRHRVDLLLVAFSLYSNIKRIFDVSTKQGELRSLNGVRYLTFVWLILGNTYIYGPVYAESWLASNIITAVRTLPREFLFQFIVNYHLNTDVFLLISGILVTWTWLRLTKHNDLSVWLVIRHVIRRYWRLAPAMMLVLMFYTCLYKYFIEGPLYPSDIGDASSCRTNWWVDAIMLHNLIERHNICLSWMFFVPLIFQLHVAALVVLVPLVKKPVIGYIVLAAAFGGYIAATAAISHDLRSEDNIARRMLRLVLDYFLVPWCRSGPYIIGMAYGIILYKTQRKVSIHPILSVIGWLVSLATIVTVIFVTYTELKVEGKFWSISQQVAYDTLARPALAVAVGWIVFTAETGNAWVVSNILRWNLFKPLSKLVYPSILVSSLMMYRYVYGSRQLFYIEKFQMFYLFIADVFYVVMMGTIFGLLFHFDVSLGLERMVSCRTYGKWLFSGNHPSKVKVKAS